MEISSTFMIGLMGTIVMMLIGIIGFFIRGLIGDLKAEVATLRVGVGDNSSEIKVLKSNHGNLENKIDEIGKGVHEINLWIRNLKQV